MHAWQRRFLENDRVLRLKKCQKIYLTTLLNCLIMRDFTKEKYVRIRIYEV